MRARSWRSPGRDKVSETMTYHLHVFPREILDLLLHPLDALQQVLVLLVHSLVLLHQGLQLDLGLTGAFQLWPDTEGSSCKSQPQRPVEMPPGLELPLLGTTSPGWCKHHEEPTDTWLPNAGSHLSLRGPRAGQQEGVQPNTEAQRPPSGRPRRQAA